MPGYDRPPQSPGGSSVLDRLSGGLLIFAAVLTIAGSIPTLDGSVDTTSGTNPNDSFTTIAKAWSFTFKSPSPGTSTTQFSGVALVTAGALAIVVAALLLAGLGRRMAPIRTLAFGAAALTFGVAVTVAISSVNDAQFDTPHRTTTFGPGFWLLVLAALVSLAAAVPAMLAGIHPSAADSVMRQPEPQAPYDGPTAFGQPQPMQPAPQFPPPSTGYTQGYGQYQIPYPPSPAHPQQEQAAPEASDGPPPTAI